MVQPAKVLQCMILLLDARINLPPPKKKFGRYRRKNLPIQISFLKKWVNKWMRLVVLPNKRHSWPQKTSRPPPKLKNYKWWFVKTCHLNLMRIKNNNLSWRYQASFALVGALKGPRGGELQPITNYRIKHVRTPTPIIYINRLNECKVGMLLMCQVKFF